MLKNGLLFAASLIIVMTLTMVGCGKNVEDNGTHVEDSGTHVEENGSTKWPKYMWTLDTNQEKTSIDEASSIAGWDVPLPVPTYLPEGCEIKEVHTGHGHSKISLIISDEEIEWKGREFSCVMRLRVKWCPTGCIPLKLVGGPLQDEGDRYDLWWLLLNEWGDYEIVLSVSKDFPTEELYKVRDNVQVCN